MEKHELRCFQDRISNLPDPIIHYILSFLESDEVVKTSLLSKRWRYLWVSVPNAFNNLVNRVLNFQNGSLNLLRFRLNAADDRVRNIYEWISEAVKRNVQEVDLTLSYLARLRCFEFPRSLLTSDSLHVLRLELMYDNLKLPPPGTGFGRLKSLHLLRVELLVDDSVRGFISSCPLLEDLRLKDCSLGRLNILEISSNSLRNLTIDNLESLYDGLWGGELMVSCEKLVSFKYVGLIAQDFIFQNLSFLDTADIQFIAEYEKGKGYIPKHAKVKGKKAGYLVCKILQGFRNAVALKLSDLFLQPYEKHEDYQFEDDQVLTCLRNYLRSVELIDFGGKQNEYELIRFILKNGHVLEKVTISSSASLCSASIGRKAKITERIKEFSSSAPNVIVKVVWREVKIIKRIEEFPPSASNVAVKDVRGN